MNGAEALRIAQAALRFVAADERRKRTREEFQAITKAATDAGRLEFDQEDGSRIVGPEDLVEARTEFRSAAASLAGYRRGLSRACQSALRSGVPVKGLDAARNGRAQS